MKKLFVLFLVCLMSLNILAQEEHLKFMGIPLTGSITTFQSKLQAKGIKYDKTTSMQLGAGCRAFNGTFSGEKARIFVYYNDKTKNVYRAKAVITYLNKSIGENKFQEFRSMLKTKYSDQVATDSEQNGHPSMSILVTDSKITHTLGFVGLYMTNPMYEFMDEISLHVDYEDVTNQVDNTRQNMDDL